MCLYKRYIVNSIGNRVMVKCGHCPACLQEKAIQRTNKIKAQFASVSDSISQDGYVPLFFTLTYDNKYVPFISKSYLHNVNWSLSIDGSLHCLVPVYRANVPVNVRSTSDYRFLQKDFGLKLLDSFDCIFCDSISLLSSLRNTDSDRIGVCYFKDAQDFIKRLRTNLYRHYGYKESFQFYICSEYGPTTMRPHFHGLLGIPYSHYQLFCDAIAESWPYDDGIKSKQYCQIARNASSYVASYVNCDTSVASFLRYNKCFAPRSSCSHGFGGNLRAFSFVALQKAYLSRNLVYLVKRNTGKSIIDVPVLYPKYIINRFFTRFKGFSRLSSDEVFSICQNPFNLSRFAQRLSLKDSEISQIQRTLLNKRTIALSNGVSLSDFSLMYADIWTIYASNLFREFVNSIVKPSDNFVAYDNIKDYYDNVVRSYSLDELSLSVEPNTDLVDFNNFPSNLQKDMSLRFAYDSYSKDKKIRSHILSKTSNI